MLSEPRSFSSLNEQERIKALYSHNILDTPREEEYDNITKLASLICHTPMAIITLIDEDRLWFKSAIGVDFSEIPRNVSFSNYSLNNPGVFEVEDASIDPRFVNHPAVKGEPYLKFYAGAPLIDENGYTLGTICVFDTMPRLLTDAQKEGLETLSKEIITHMALRAKSAELDAKILRFEEMRIESKRAESELTKLSFVASKINNAVVINDANNHVTWVNEAFEKITGFTLDDLKGKRLGDLISGPKTDLQLVGRARELTKQNQSFTVDLLAYRKDKKPIWLSIYNTVVLDDEGNADTEVEIIIDITDKKNAEEELQVLSLVASETNTGVNISDEEGLTTWINSSLERLTGYTLEDLQGKRLIEVLSNDEVKTANHESYSIEVAATTKNGVPVWLLISNTPVVNEKGKLERQIDLVTDITQRKQVERELVESKEQALQLSEAKEMFLSVMSHEIRTPLNSVIGMSHLLLENNPSDSQIGDLNILRFSAENLLNIINDILDFTKIETGNLQLESIPLNIKALASDIVNSLLVSSLKENNKLEMDYDPNIPFSIMGDKTRLYQILMNLLGNAIKFTSNGVIKLVTRLVSETETDALIYFEVSDNGIGIAEDKQSYIFETFTQAKTDISRKYGGTGLGLAITKKLIQLYDSDIAVKSKEGVGTTFSFTIRFSKAVGLTAINEAAQESASFAGKKILVVDDNDINILIARRILDKWGLELDFASSGPEAIEKISNQAFDLVFMDIRMPNMDGFEATDIIRGMEGDYFKTVPIIALTASSLDDEDIKFRHSGMNGHVLKPFRPDDMKNIIGKYLVK